MNTELRQKIDQSAIKLEQRAVLDWLCRNPAKKYSHGEIAEALNIHKGKAERLIADLKHQRNGAHLAVVGPHGEALRTAVAYLPPDAPIRKEYPPIVHPDPGPPPEKTEKKNPALVKSAHKALRKQQLLELRKQRKEARHRNQVTVAADTAAEREQRLLRRAENLRKQQAALAAHEAAQKPPEQPKEKSKVKNAG